MSLNRLGTEEQRNNGRHVLRVVQKSQVKRFEGEARTREEIEYQTGKLKNERFTTGY